MADFLTVAQRSALMSRIRSKNSAAELRLRYLVFAMGYRYRLHRAELPGIPDLAFPGLRKVIFMHGCYWHRHRCKAGQSVPKTQTSFWQEKFDYNVARDARNLRKLRRLGWGVLVVWECQTKDRDKLERRIARFLQT